MYATIDYGITYTYFMTVVLWPTLAYEQRDKLVTLQWEQVMGRYFTPDTVLRDRRQNLVMKQILLMRTDKITNV